MAVAAMNFGTTKNGDAVTKYVLTNDSGMSVSVLDYGCIVQSVIVPDRNGTPTDVVLGYDTMEAYEKGTCFLGTFVGRFANRIGGSAFTLNGTKYTLEPNEGENHLHGAFVTKLYGAEVNEDENSVTFRLVSPDGEEGYPGTLTMAVTYRLTADSELLMEYQAETDADTVINLTNHSYFNLDGHDSGSTDDHMLMMKASRFTAIRPDSIPTGELIPVEGTPMDFRTEKAIAQDRDADYEQLRLTSGYDHNFVLDTTGMDETAARVRGGKSGICMECRTTQPGVQFYNSNFLQGDAAIGMGKGGASYAQYGALCLETQHFPDSPNQPSFPSTVLRAGEQYHEVTGYRFSAE